MEWLYGEPRIEEMLADPVIRAVLERDRIDVDRLRILLRDVQQMRQTPRHRGGVRRGEPALDAA
jgi:hypothetical protein